MECFCSVGVDIYIVAIFIKIDSYKKTLFSFNKFTLCFLRGLKNITCAYAQLYFMNVG